MHIPLLPLSDIDMKLLVVTGTFDEGGGKPSYIGSQLVTSFSHWSVVPLNGGNLDLLTSVVETLKAYDAVIWMPNIDNSVDKFLPRLKEVNPKCLLVSSKRVIEKEYTEFDIVCRLLKTKSNLGIMITKEQQYRFRVIDPLGNGWIDTVNVSELGVALEKRLTFLAQMTRIGSKRIGDAIDFSLPEDYLRTVRWYGNEFHKYVNAVNPSRFLGNTSTRCMSGFPGLRKETTYVVSRRNVDKEGMTAKDFVEVSANESQVEYYGDNKPSVDTPIQIRLFNFYKNVNYMIHGHVYVSGAPKTERVLPCGAVEEFEEIKRLMPLATATDFAINLRGHGCLLLARDGTFLRKVRLESRPFVEQQI